MSQTVRWSADQVLALAPDAAAQRSARGLATPRPWSETGYADADGPTVWGLCQGSGSKPYQTCVDVGEPAYRCSCPSRKLPCKHVLGLLLRWSAGAVVEGEPPAWVHEWQAGRATRAERAVTTTPRRTAQAGPKRAERVTGGLDELDRWLGDQVRGGLAGAASAGYAHWDAMAARLIDAQAPGAAGAVRRLAGSASDAGRLLAELALLRLLVSAHRRLPELPDALAATVRSRVGYPMATDDVLATPPVRDTWLVIGVRDEIDERLTTRRTWLRGASGRPALVLAFAAPGQLLAADLVLGTAIDADLCFYPGAQPLRAVVATRHAPADPDPGPPATAGGSGVAVALRGYAEATAADPWLDRWPVLLGAVTPGRSGGQWWVRDEAGDALPLTATEPWRLVAAAGGEPVTLAGEWTPVGLRPLTAWVEGRVVKL